ncbi:MAG: hypothetical protein ACD_79C01091G0004 [uncultured bacterium]|nr:MAG: hypothetical protein ACD_79C01091G0004 [uncultured bacterium]
MNNSKYKKIGFTLVEILISLSIISVLFVIFFAGFNFSKISIVKNQTNTKALQRVEKAFNYLKKDLTWSLGIDTSEAWFTTATGYTNSAASVILKMPSIDNTGTIIMVDGGGADVPLGTYVDYLYLYLDPADKCLKLETHVDTTIPVASSRSDGVETLAQEIEDLVFGDGTKSLADMTNSEIDDLNYLHLSVTCQFNDAQNKSRSKNLSTKIMFRNKNLL